MPQNLDDVAQASSHPTSGYLYQKSGENHFGRWTSAGDSGGQRVREFLVESGSRWRSALGRCSRVCVSVAVECSLLKYRFVCQGFFFDGEHDFQPV